MRFKIGGLKPHGYRQLSLRDTIEDQDEHDPIVSGSFLQSTLNIETPQAVSKFVAAEVTRRTT